MTEPSTTTVVQQCPDCQQQVVAVRCGERMGEQVCEDLFCPVCGEELPVTSDVG